MLRIIARLVAQRDIFVLKRSAEGRSERGVDKNVCGVAVFCFKRFIITAMIGELSVTQRA
jgi:hypothetical protein